MFSQKLKELRSERGLTQKQIAEQLNMSQQGYARWESGKIQPSIPTIEKFANFFNIPVSQLLSEETESIEIDDFLNKPLTYHGKPLSEKDEDRIKDIVRVALTDL